MSKKTFVIFGLLVVFLAVLIPWLAFRSRGDAETGAQQVPADLKTGQTLFQTNCGTCHTLYAAGTDGNFAPDLDVLLAPSGPPSGPTAQQTINATKGRVLNAIDNGVDSTTPGRMPAGILDGEQAQQVAEFVATEAGKG
jgi:mono/diheme cytochrome c family protein